MERFFKIIKKVHMSKQNLEFFSQHKRKKTFVKTFSYLAGMSPYISLKIKKRHYEHHMIEAHKYLITWISDDIFFLNSG